MEGTRKNPGVTANWPVINEHRYLVHFRDRGNPEWIVQVELPEPAGLELRWLSYDDTEALDDTEEGPQTSPREGEDSAGAKGEGKSSRRQKRQAGEHAAQVQELGADVAGGPGR